MSAEGFKGNARKPELCLVHPLLVTCYFFHIDTDEVFVELLGCIRTYFAAVRLNKA